MTATAPQRSEATMQMFSGGAFDLMNPQAADVNLSDCAHAIARINRYNGHFGAPFYSVAQHSWLTGAIAQLVAPDQEMACVLHDVPEAIFGDMTTTVKRFFRLSGAGAALDKLERGVEKVVFERLAYGSKVRKNVLNAIDLYALQLERKSFMRPCREALIWSEESIQSGIDGGLSKTDQVTLGVTFSKPLKPWPPSVAERMFLEAYKGACVRTPGAGIGVLVANEALDKLDDLTQREVTKAELEGASSDSYVPRVPWEVPPLLSKYIAHPLIVPGVIKTTDGIGS
jgi:hypothetical protein